MNLQHKFHSSKVVTAVLLALFLVQPLTAIASSWSPTLLVNTESFQTIDDGDGTTNIQLKFGTTGKILQWNTTETTLQFNGNAEIQGTASGRTVHAQDQLQSSGSLAIEGAAAFGSTLKLNNIVYTFPYGDGTSSGKVLKTDGAGNLVWSTDLNTGSQNVFQTFAVSGQSNVDADSSTDTVTIAAGSNVTITTNATTDTITIAATDTNTTYAASQGLTLASGFFRLNAALTGTSLEVIGTASGREIHAQDTLTSSGTLIVEGNSYLHGTLSGNTIEGFNLTTCSAANSKLLWNSTTKTFSCGTDVDTDTTYSAAQGLTLASGFFKTNAALTGTSLEIIGTASGRELHAQDALTSSGVLSIEGGVSFGGVASCANLKTSATGVLSCNTTDYVETTEIDTESELETILTDVSNVLTNNDNSDSLTEGSTNLYFTNERVDDRVGALLQAGTGVSLSYNDTANTLTVSVAQGSGGTVYLNPNYNGAVFYGSGSNNIGQLALAYDTTNKENYYKWTSTKSTLQNYVIAVRVKIPENFAHWKATPISFRYRTNTSSSADNKLSLSFFDTAGTEVTLTGGSNLANTSWTTASVTGPNSTGTYTPGSYVTILVRTFATTTNSGEAHVGYINLNWVTNRP